MKLTLKINPLPTEIKAMHGVLYFRVRKLKSQGHTVSYGKSPDTQTLSTSIQECCG